MITMKENFEEIFFNEDNFTLSELEDFYRLNEYESIKMIFLTLEEIANDEIVRYVKLITILNFIQKWYPFNIIQDKEFIEKLVFVLIRVTSDLNTFKKSHSAMNIIFDIFWHNPDLFKNMEIKIQCRFCEILSTLTSVKYDIEEEKYSDLYFTISKSIMILAYLDKNLCLPIFNAYLNHFDNRIRESFVERFNIEHT
jgi:hypothetical protein